MGAAELLDRADAYLRSVVNKADVGPHHLISDLAAALRAASLPPQAQAQGEPQGSGEVELRRLADLAFPYREGTFYFESNEMRDRFTDLAVSYFSRPAQAATKSAPLVTEDDGSRDVIYPGQVGAERIYGEADALEAALYLLRGIVGTPDAEDMVIFRVHKDVVAALSAPREKGKIES